MSFLKGHKETTTIKRLKKEEQKVETHKQIKFNNRKKSLFYF